MLKNFVALAIRNFRNKATYYSVNIAGLAIGIAACLLISHYVRFHKSFDKYPCHSHRTYRITYARWSEDGDKVQFASATPVIGNALKENIPEIEKQGQAYRMDGIFSYQDRYFEETRAFMAESDLLPLLGIQITDGMRENPLDRPGTALLSRSAAKKYFGNEPAVGKTLYHNRESLYQVVGVYEDIPAHSHFQADLFLSLESWKQRSPNLFLSGHFTSGFYNYVRLREGTDPKLVNQKIKEYVEQTYAEILEAYNIGMGFALQPLEDIHLHSGYMHELELNGNATSIRFLEIIAWFILIIAWVNFFNLSTIAAIKRMREICIRKVNGASSFHLIKQLLTESAMINLLAVLMALLLLEIFAPLFFGFADMPVGFPVWRQGWVFIFLLVAFVVGTLSAGIYSATGIPAAKLSEMLKGSALSLPGKKNTRKILVTVQFVIAIGLIASTTAIYRQYQMLARKDLGFRVEDMLVVHSPLISDSLSFQRLQTMKRELRQMPEFSGATFSSVVPGKPNMFNRGGVHVIGEDPNSGKNYRITDTDEDFFKVYQIEVIAGEDFTGYADIDRERAMLNAHAARFMGFHPVEEAVGKQISADSEVLTIAGVVDDFHQLSPKEAIEPQIFRMARRHKGYLTMGIEGGSYRQAIDAAERLYQEFFPGNPFNYFFLNDYYEAQNQAEKRFSTVLLLFSILVIIITILGLMGLSAYTAEQKKKEIGIRKVLGARKLDIFGSLFRDYVLLWALGGVLALPVVYYLLEKWLNSFAMRIEQSALFFVIPVFTVIVITLITVFAQSLRVLQMNPTTSIRSE